MNLDGPKLETYLDPLETQEPRLLLLQPLEYFIRVVAIHVRFLHQRERNTVIKLAERRDLLVCARFLTTELMMIQQTMLGQYARQPTQRVTLNIPGCTGSRE